jgi:hypothetical protein
MIKSNIAVGETTDMFTGHLTSPGQASTPVFGYVQPTRLYKLGKRVLVYRAPGDGKQLAISKPLVFLIVMLLAAFATGYVNGGHEAKQSGGRALPTAVVPINSIHKLITISVVRGVFGMPATTKPIRLAQIGPPCRTV